MALLFIVYAMECCKNGKWTRRKCRTDETELHNGQNFLIAKCAKMQGLSRDKKKKKLRKKKIL